MPNDVLALTKSTNDESLIQLVTADVESPHTKRAYTTELRRFFKWCAATPNDGFTRQTVLAYRNAETRGPVSVNLALSAIRKLARTAADADMMAEGVAGGIERVAGLPAAKQRRLGNWLSLEQLKTLLASPPPTSKNRGMRDRTSLWIMGTCGLRREEAAGLQVKHLQQRDGRPALVDFVSKGNKLRTAPIHHLADTAIRSWLEFAQITEPDAYILPSIALPDRITAEPTTGARLYDAVVRYAESCNAVWRPHDLRRTFAVLAKKGGADIEDIRVALGHASVVTTEYYLRAPMSMEHAAADRIAL